MPLFLAMLQTALGRSSDNPARLHRFSLTHMGCLLQVIDPHTHQYLDRLKDEPLFLALAQKVSDHLARTGDTKVLFPVTRCSLSFYAFCGHHVS